jgi:hypothetical protein
MYCIDRHTGSVTLIRPIAAKPTPADARKAIRDFQETDGAVDKQR